jgi:hopanoid biosynthesis associated protein HpnK
MAGLGLDIFAHRAVRRQVEAEIEAQFEAFAATGLRLDHVNAHKHFHLHPTVARIIVAVGRRHGMRGLRVPVEPRHPLKRAEPRASPGMAWAVASWGRMLGRKARRAGLQTPDAVFGLAWTGAMTAPRLTGLLQNLPDGMSEIYMHPATRDTFAGHAPGYRYVDELAALTAPNAIAAVRRPDIRLGGYTDF